MVGKGSLEGHALGGPPSFITITNKNIFIDDFPRISSFGGWKWCHCQHCHGMHPKPAVLDDWFRLLSLTYLLTYIPILLSHFFFFVVNLSEQSSKVSAMIPAEKIANL